MRDLHLRRPSYDHRHRVASRDGWPIAIYEYRPPEYDRDAVPILCCHGLNCRYGIFDGGDGFGLAPWLARRGYHVFAVDLRGRGLSAPRGRLARAGVFMGRGWTLGDFLSKDLPTAIELVLERTGAIQLDLVGHSMGGMLLLERLARTGDTRVRKLVTVGSGDAPAMLLPLSEEQQQVERPQRKANVGMFLAPFALSTRYAPVHWAARLGALAMPFAPESMRINVIDPILDTLLNPTNVEPAVLRYFLWRSLSGISSKKFWSFGKMYRQFAKEGVEPNRHKHPTLLLAGARDNLVPPAKVRETASRASHPDTRVVECSIANGFSANYGHVDLLLGRNVEHEIFPIIERFFESAAIRLDAA